MRKKEEGGDEEWVKIRNRQRGGGYEIGEPQKKEIENDEES